MFENKKTISTNNIVNKTKINAREPFDRWHCLQLPPLDLDRRNSVSLYTFPFCGHVSRAVGVAVVAAAAVVVITFVVNAVVAIGYFVLRCPNNPSPSCSS